MKSVIASENPGEKPYWHWICDCGFDDNRNTDDSCQKCGKIIDCNTAGGHGTCVPPHNNTCAKCGKEM